MRLWFLIVALFGLVFSAGAQDLPPMDEGAENEKQINESKKSPATGALLGALILGGGHFYAGEGGTGLALLAVGGGSVGVGYALSSCETDQLTTECNYTPLYIGLGINAVTWLVSVIDGTQAVHRYNRRIESAVKFRPIHTRNGPGISLAVQL